MTVERRTVLKGAAWAVPVVAVAVSTPLSAASTVSVIPAKCIRITPNHGHGGDPGNKDWWQGVYSDGSTTKPMSNGEAMSSKEWGELCRAAKKEKG